MYTKNHKWLEQQERERVEKEANQKPKFFNSFDEYVAAYPEGSRWKHMVEGGILLATYEHCTCLEGWYLIAKIQQCKRYDSSTKKLTDEIVTSVLVEDGDDFMLRKCVKNLEEAQEELNSLKDWAPFNPIDLYCFDYED